MSYIKWYVKCNIFIQQNIKEDFTNIGKETGKPTTIVIDGGGFHEKEEKKKNSGNHFGGDIYTWNIALLFFANLLGSQEISSNGRDRMCTFVRLVYHGRPVKRRKTYTYRATAGRYFGDLVYPFGGMEAWSCSISN